MNPCESEKGDEEHCDPQKERERYLKWLENLENEGREEIEGLNWCNHRALLRELEDLSKNEKIIKLFGGIIGEPIERLKYSPFSTFCIGCLRSWLGDGTFKTKTFQIGNPSNELFEISGKYCSKCRTFWYQAIDGIKGNGNYRYLIDFLKSCCS